MKKRKIFRKGATVTFLSPQKEKSLDPLKIKAFLLAEKEGFEPSRRSTRPTPLAGEPLRPLGYFCMPNTGYIWKKCGGESGIRTHGCFHIAGFQDRFLQPLGHLSTSGLRPNAKKMIPHFSHIVNCRLQYFSAFFPNSALTWSGVQVIKSNKQREPARRKEQMTL